MARSKNERQDVSWSYLFTRTNLRIENMEQVNFKELLIFPNYVTMFYYCMTKSRNKKSLLGIFIHKKYFQKRKYVTS